MRAAPVSILVTALAAVGISAPSALAADIPVKAPVMVPVAAPVYYWTGFYAGVHGGYSWHKANGLYDQLDVAGPADLSGLRLRGAVLGGQVGYNFQVNSFVFGIEADGSWAKADRTVFSPEPPVRGPDPVTAERDYLVSVRGRLGLAWQQALFYGTAGIGFTRYDLTITEVLPPPVTGSTRIKKSGLVWGGGAEYALTPALSLRAEYLQYRLGTTLGLDPLVYPDADPGDFVRLHHINVVRAGLNFRFGGDAPVSSRY
jgi:outer membrane immunogenic protein